MDEAEQERGWGFPGNSRKAHYFVGMRSLCGRWAFTGRLDPDAKSKSADDCVECRRKLDRMTGASQRAES